MNTPKYFKSILLKVYGYYSTKFQFYTQEIQVNANQGFNVRLPKMLR